MKPLEILSSVAGMMEKIEVGSYQPISEIPDMPELNPLAQSLAVIGAKLEDYMVSGSDTGNYLCNPAIQKNQEGELVLFFSPEKVYYIPLESVLLDEKDLIVADDAEPIVVRKITGVGVLAKYKKISDSIVQKEQTKITPLTNFIQDNYLDGYKFSFSNIQSKVSKKGFPYSYANVTATSEDDVKEALVFLDSKLNTTLSVLKALGKPTELELKVEEYTKNNGTTGLKVVQV